MASVNAKEKDIQSFPLIELGVATKTLKGQAESGDLFVVKPVLAGCLVGVVDGLGHGEEAADAARRAVSTIEAYANESVITILRRCHDLLRSTRGVVANLAVFNGRDETVTWVGVGNVEGVLYRSDHQAVPPSENIIVRGGVIGYQLPQLYATVIPVTPGDTLVFATDGVASHFREGVKLSDSPQHVADNICNGFAKDIDDALVLVARYVGKNKL
ncbi:MAG: SpoIIE family protein phosphatase [Ignavibacteriae bacterium]|nr:SpoIIE family protein phosphatase [Ignavibacteriota bacterium]